MGILGYLKEGWGENRLNRVARFRLRNEIKKRKYWKEKKRNAECTGERERHGNTCGKNVGIGQQGGEIGRRR